MKNKTSIITAIIVVSLTIGIVAYAHGPDGGFRGNYGMGGDNYGMMGRHGMTGGYGSGHGMMDGYGHNENGYNRDMWNQNRYNSRDYRKNSPNFRSESEPLINEIVEKRNELSSLFRSDNADKALIDRKVKELNRLERNLDERIR